MFATASLRCAFADLARVFEQRQGSERLGFAFAAAGLLLDRLKAGERADVYASANFAHPCALKEAGRARLMQCFAQNLLRALVRSDVEVTQDTLIEWLLDPAIRRACIWSLSSCRSSQPTNAKKQYLRRLHLR